MIKKDFNIVDFSPEFVFKTSRSSGAGGQNVNKVNTKVELRFKIESSNLFNDEEKAILIDRLSSKINADGELIIVSQTERTQLGNKQKCIEKFYKIIGKALEKKKTRVVTKPTMASKIKRLTEKRIKSERKSMRQKPFGNE